MVVEITVKKAWNKLVLASVLCLLFMVVEITGRKTWDKLVLTSGYSTLASTNLFQAFLPVISTPINNRHITLASTICSKLSWNKLVLASVLFLLFMFVGKASKKAWNKLVLASVLCLLFIVV
jgi:hypothetical protein